MTARWDLSYIHEGFQCGQWTVMRLFHARNGKGPSRQCEVVCNCGRKRMMPVTELASGYRTRCVSCYREERDARPLMSNYRMRYPVYHYIEDYDLPSFLKAITPDTMSNFGSCRAHLPGELR